MKLRFLFKEFTQIDSTETALQFLSVHDWDVERAVNTALTSNAELPPSPPPPPPPPPPPVESPRNERQIPPNTSAVARYMPNSALYV